MNGLRRWIIKKLGGYSDADEALDYLKKDSKERYRILTLAVKRLFNTVGAEDVLHENEEGQWLLEGRPLSKGQKDQLIAEAVQFREGALWKALQLDIKYKSNRKMYLEATDEVQMAAGKLWLYTLDAIKTRLSSIKDGSAEFNSKK